MNLPLFLTRRWKYPAGAVMFSLAYVFYFLTNHYPLFTPRTLPMTWIDESVPFLPLTVFIYVSEYLFFTVVFITSKNMENLNKYLYSFFTLQTFSCLIFLFWPTTYPRELFPVPADAPRFVHQVWAWLRAQDAPTNCFPSLHVSSVYLSAFIYLDEQREKFPIFLIWGSMIAFSTLPTKQHYVADVVMGLILAVGTYWLFHRGVQYRKVSWLSDPQREYANR